MSDLVTTSRGRAAGVIVTETPGSKVVEVTDGSGEVTGFIVVPVERIPSQPGDASNVLPPPTGGSTVNDFSAGIVPSANEQLIFFTLEAGQAEEAKILFYPDTVTNKRGTWKIDKTSVATVVGIRENNGDCYRARVNARAAGTAKISWTAAANGQTYTRELTVKAAIDRPNPTPMGNGIVGSGLNDHNSLGVGMESGATPTQLSGVTDLGIGPGGKLAAGNSASVFIDSDGKINGVGTGHVLGIAGLDALEYWGVIDEDNTYIDVDASTFILAVRSDNRLAGCGHDGSGALGRGGVIDPNKVVESLTVIGTELYQSCACSFATGYALKMDGTPQSCGDNSCGQLGIGASSDVPVTSFQDMLTDVKFKKLSANGDSYDRFDYSPHFFVAGLSVDGYAYVCGRHEHGALGLGDTTQVNVMTKISDEVYVDIATGPNALYLLRENGTLDACGLEYWGQLGTGRFGEDENQEMYHIKIPVAVNDGDTYKAIFSSRGDTFYAINADDRLKSCGQNLYAQLGFPAGAAGEGFNLQIFAYLPPKPNGYNCRAHLTQVGENKYLRAAGGRFNMLAEKL